MVGHVSPGWLDCPPGTAGERPLADFAALMDGKPGMLTKLPSAGCSRISNGRATPRYRCRGGRRRPGTYVAAPSAVVPAPHAAAGRLECGAVPGGGTDPDMTAPPTRPRRQGDHAAGGEFGTTQRFEVGETLPGQGGPGRGQGPVPVRRYQPDAGAPVEQVARPGRPRGGPPTAVRPRSPRPRRRRVRASPGRPRPRRVRPAPRRRTGRRGGPVPPPGRAAPVSPRRRGAAVPCGTPRP